MVKTEQKITHTSSSSSISSSSSSKPMASSSKATSPSSSSSSACSKKKYKGVRMRSWGSWVSEIRAPNQKTRIWLGSYSTAEAAARAYDAALLCLKGSSANLNFPISASSHFIPQGEITNMSPKSIQRVAAAAANSFLADDNNDVITTPTNNNVSSPSSSSPPPPSPPLHSSSSSSIVSSPSMSSSPLNLVDDDMSSLMGSFDTSFGSYTPTYDHDHQLPIMSTMEPWSNFDDGLQYSPKYLDQMLNGALFDPPTTYDFYEDCDIPLWSFC